nr:MAG TPA_asm: hypothetical protein [Caudoviricetes sp.]
MQAPVDHLANNKRIFASYLTISLFIQQKR